MKLIKILMISIIIPALFFSIAAKALIVDQMDCQPEGNTDLTWSKASTTMHNNQMEENSEDRKRVTSIVKQAPNVYNAIIATRSYVPGESSAQADTIIENANTIINSINSSNDRCPLNRDTAEKLLKELTEANESMGKLLDSRK